MARHAPRPRRQRMSAHEVHQLRLYVNARTRRVDVALYYGISSGYVTRLMLGQKRQYDAPLCVPEPMPAVLPEQVA
jgi:hypothetical protein